MRNERVQRCIEAAHMPDRHMSTPLNPHPKQKRVFDQVNELVGTGAIVVLAGNRGTGKTQIACEVIKTVCANGKKAEYVKAMALFLAIRETYGGKGSEAQAITRYVAPVLLVIDEFQERTESAFEDRVLTHIIDRRYDALKDTIIVTNLTPVDFANKAGASIMDRIRETGTIIECAWESFRVKL